MTCPPSHGKDSDEGGDQPYAGDSNPPLQHSGKSLPPQGPRRMPRQESALGGGLGTTAPSLVMHSNSWGWGEETSQRTPTPTKATAAGVGSTHTIQGSGSWMGSGPPLTLPQLNGKSGRIKQTRLERDGLASLLLDFPRSWTEAQPGAHLIPPPAAQDGTPPLPRQAVGAHHLLVARDPGLQQ